MNDIKYKVAVNDEQETCFYSYLLLIEKDNIIFGHLIECRPEGGLVSPGELDFSIKGIRIIGPFQSIEEVPKSWTILDESWKDSVLPAIAINKIMEIIEFESDLPNGLNQA